MSKVIGIERPADGFDTLVGSKKDSCEKNILRG